MSEFFQFDEYIVGFHRHTFWMLFSFRCSSHERPGWPKHAEHALQSAQQRSLQCLWWVPRPTHCQMAEGRIKKKKLPTDTTSNPRTYFWSIKDCESWVFATYWRPQFSALVPFHLQVWYPHMQTWAIDKSQEIILCSHDFSCQQPNVKMVDRIRY